MTERWYWLAVDASGRVHRGSQPTLERVQRVTERFPIRCYTTDPETTAVQREALLQKHRSGDNQVRPLGRRTTMSTLNTQTLKELVSTYNGIVPADRKVKGFSDKPTAIKRIKAAQAEFGKSKAKAATKKTTKKSAAKKGKRTGPSNFEKIREHFKTHKTAKREQLKKLTGWDDANVHTAMSILRNPQRMSESSLVFTTYDRESQTYTKAKA